MKSPFYFALYYFSKHHELKPHVVGKGLLDLHFLM